MPDLSAPLGAILELVGPLLKRVVRTFLATAFGVAVVVLLTLAQCLYIVRDSGSWAIVVTAALTLISGFVLGWILALKNAVSAAVLVGLTKLDLGRRVLALLFDRLLAVQDDQYLGERGSTLAQRLEKLPLLEAEVRMREVTDGLLGQRAQQRGARGYVARKVQRSTLHRVERLTLASFRKADAEYGGVDLIRVRDDLSSRINPTLERAVRAAGRRLIYLSLSLFVGASVSAALLLRAVTGQS